MVSKLSFKGDKSKKRKSKDKPLKVDDINHGTSHKRSKIGTDDIDYKQKEQPLEARSWVSARSPDEISGPILFVSVSLLFSPYLRIYYFVFRC